MAFDSDTRSKLARMVTQARQLLTDEFTQQLQEIYGIQPDGTITALEKLTHLNDEEAGAAKFLRERIDHLASGLTTKKKPVVIAIDRVVREQAFTIQNRFAALRMCEERGLVEECVRKGMQSKGFKVYETIAGSGLGNIYERYKTFLFSLFDEIAVDLGVLFDRFSPQGLLFPREQALLEILTIINNNELSKLWAEDETIGWIYQYFNPPEERKAMREASQAPRNSKELAVRNQFFTPRYVVEFLNDNTLGRIWYEMRKGNTSLKEECSYLVRRPNEAFLAPRDKAPAEPQNKMDLSQEELLKKPIYIEHRPKKDPRDLKVLDPACGSGHFLLYAFDLLERIYEEGWKDPESPPSEITGQSLRQDFETLEELHRSAPKLIIEHNLHGIDIDPRAVQIAALALWLRAQKTWKSIGLDSDRQPYIAKSNIVTAEPMPGEDDMRREFTAALKPRVLGQLVYEVFNKMKLAGEAGSLLEIEEEIKKAITEAKKQWLEGPKMEQAELFPEMAKAKPKQQQLQFDLTGVTDKKFWDQAEDQILAALKDYSERAENGHTIRRRLFAEDAAHGFAFLDLCRKKYNVVLMNPPFGVSSGNAYTYLKEHYTSWNKNLLCAFFSRSVDMAQDRGLIGSVYDRSAAIKMTYEDFRKDLFLSNGRFQTQSDLGWEVLDANVEVSAGIISSSQIRSPDTFFDVTREIPEEKGEHLKKGIDDLGQGKENSHVFICKSTEFLKLPNSVLAFQFPVFVRRLFSKERPLGQSGCRSFKGHDFKSDRHLRLFWEIPSLGEIGFDKGKYTRVFNGGEYSPYYHRSRDVALYGNKGSLINCHESVTFRNFNLQGIGGVGYGKRGIYLDAQLIPKELTYTAEGIGCVVESEDDSFYYAALLNSQVFQFIINLYSGQHKSSSYVNCFPNPPSSKKFYDEVVKFAREIWQLKKLWQQGDETDTVFLCPWILHNGSSSLSFCINTSLKKEKKFDEIISNKTERIENCFENIYRIPKSDLHLIKNYCEQRPKDRVWHEGSDVPQTKAFDHVDAMISYAVGCVYGRWDIRMGKDQTISPKPQDTFDPLPVCPPGMLVGTDGLPAKSSEVVSEEWLRARPDANTLPANGTFKKPTIPDSDYPLDITWNGILVGYSAFTGGQSHPDDIIRRIREVLGLLWKDKAQEIEQEACNILGVSDLYDYFSRPSGFFQDHLKRYSKSRRKAPIYWPLSTKSGFYTLWIYYHRLTDQTLYACVNDYVNPNLDILSKDIVRLKDEVDKQGLIKNRKKFEQLMDFEQELKDFRDELLQVAGLPYKPNLNDGVMITAAPLWKLFRHNKWRKDLESCWKKLKEGKYDWAHLANTIWPDRVKEKCKTDLSIAIAHDLEYLYQGDNNKPEMPREKAT